MSFCELRNVRKRYNGRTVLDVDSLTIDAGRITAVTGANGSGKTTLLETIALLNRPDEGTVHLWRNAADVGDYRLRRTVVMVMHPGLMFRGTVWSNTLYGLRATGVSGAEARRRAERALDAVGMTEFARRDPTNLSAGERQRVNLARAIALHPKALLLDEPTANVDDECVEVIRRVMVDLCHRDGVTVVHASPVHNALADVSSAVIHLDHGRPRVRERAGGDL